MRLFGNKNAIVPKREHKLEKTFSELIESFFNDDFLALPLSEKNWNPRTDVIENDKEIIIKSDIPGVDEKNISVELNDNIITICGKREEEKGDIKKGRYERFTGSFCRSFTLPSDIQADKISAEYKKGILTVKIPKNPDSKVKKINVKVS